MNIKIAILLLLLLVNSTSGLAQVNCAGLSKAQCTMVTIVKTCHLGGTGYVVEEGRVTINGKLVGHINNLGEVVDDKGRIITELTKKYTQSCK